MPLTSFTAVSQKEQKPFRMKEASYRSWMHNENIKGTDIIITLSGVRSDVEFVSVTFRGIEVPVAKTIRGRRVILKATITPGESLVEPNIQKVTGLSDRLNYTIGGEEAYTPVADIRREKQRVRQ